MAKKKLDQYIVSISLDRHEDSTLTNLTFFLFWGEDKPPSPLQVAEKFKLVCQEAVKDYNEYAGKHLKRKATADEWLNELFHRRCHEAGEEFDLFQANGFYSSPDSRYPVKGWISLSAMNTFVSDHPEEEWSFRPENRRADGEVSLEIFDIVLFKEG